MSHRVEPRLTTRTKSRSRQLRREAPIPERILWSLLRARRLAGLKFRRQQPIGPYIADFFCESAKIVVELDGRSHDKQEQADAARDEYLSTRGLRVLRIQNDDLLKNRQLVAEMIVEAATTPSPLGRGPG